MPKTVDKTARRGRRARRKPHEESTPKALVDGRGRGGLDRPLRDLSDIAGTWVEDPAIDAALGAQDRVDVRKKKIEAGLADADSGRVVSHGEVRRRFSRTR
ncbi:MAG: hypothetical protein IPK07_34375 [Deltaproteobacteria bacterium]|nr:hypothetical protein [Deltaproteobacteria bacterium]